MSEQNCIQCGQNIAHKRKDAKYCSARCRMRYKRAQSKRVLVNKLVDLCTQIPNHVVYNDNEIEALALKDAKSGSLKKIGIKTLENLNDDEIKQLIKVKQGEVYAYKILNGIPI